MFAMQDVLLKAERDENQEDGPGGSVKKAVRLHPQSPLFLFHEPGEVTTLQTPRSKLKGFLWSAPSYDPARCFLKEILIGSLDLTGESASRFWFPTLRQRKAK